MAKSEIGGAWRTIGGRRVFIKEGQDLATAMRESGKFGKHKTEYKTSLDKPSRLNENGDIAEKIIEDEEINDMSVHRFKDEVIIENERTGEKIKINPNDDRDSLMAKIKKSAGVDTKR